MPDETTFELASVEFGAEPVAVFRFGYERFELRARLGPGNLEHAIASAAEVAASVFARWSHEALAFAQRVRAGEDGGPVRHKPRVKNERTARLARLPRIPAKVSSSKSTADAQPPWWGPPFMPHSGHSRESLKKDRAGWRAGVVAAAGRCHLRAQGGSSAESRLSSKRTFRFCDISRFG